MPSHLTTLFASLTILLPATAMAQSTSIEAARAYADSVIERHDASEWFENVTSTDAPTVLHRPSGMMCEFVGMDEKDTIRFYDPTSSGPVRGEDVSCGTWIGRTYVTVFATRYPQQYSAEDLFASAIQQLTNNWPQAAPTQGPFEMLTLQGQPEPLMAVFNVELEGETRKSIILLRNIGEWSFKARATGPGSDDTAIEFGTMQFALSLPQGIEAAPEAR